MDENNLTFKSELPISDERKRELEDKLKEAVKLMNEFSNETGYIVSLMNTDFTGEFISMFLHNHTSKPSGILLVNKVENITGCLDKEFQVPASEIARMEEEDEEDGENE